MARPVPFKSEERALNKRWDLGVPTGVTGACGVDAANAAERRLDDSVVDNEGVRGGTGVGDGACDIVGDAAVWSAEKPKLLLMISMSSESAMPFFCVPAPRPGPLLDRGVVVALALAGGDKGAEDSTTGHAPEAEDRARASAGAGAVDAETWSPRRRRRAESGWLAPRRKAAESNLQVEFKSTVPSPSSDKPETSGS
mmetsp:Transcript_71026/g.197298  ORF Transcript_71026/g.197298 Transcript_71026/m.197298 type:complete len:197 (+) Transcript_71026:113-703(+)